MKRYIPEIIIILLLGAIYIIPALNTFTTADSNLYIDAGKRLIIEKQAVLCFDIYQSTPDKCMPSLPYIPPLWPIIAGLLFFIGGLKAVSIFNIIIVISSAILLFKIARRILPTIWALASVILAYTTMPILLISTYPWTESLSLLLLNLLIYVLIALYPDIPKKNICIAAIINGLIFLTRPQYFSPATLIGIILSDKQNRIKFVISSLILPITYELFCITKYRQIYPQIYITISKNSHLFHNQAQLNLTNALTDLGRSITQLIVNPITILFLASGIGILYIKNNPHARKDLNQQILLIAVIVFATYPALLIIRTAKEIIYALAH